MISLDNWLNETTRHAHVILPGSSVLEQPHYDEMIWSWAVRNAGKYSQAIFETEPERLPEWQSLLMLAAILQGHKAADVNVEAVDNLFFAGIAAAIAADPKSAIAGRDPGEILAQAGPPGPERMLDFAIRIGPWGDGYGRNPGGLTLAELAAQPNGIDMGALEPRLPGLLKTKSGKIELAPPYITADIPRLRERLARRDDGLVLVSRRHVRSNNSWMHNVSSLMTGKDRCTLLVHPDDARAAGLVNGRAARISSSAGSIVAPVEVSDEMRPGVVCLPHGWGHDKPGTRTGVASARPGVCNNAIAPGELVDVLSGNAIVNGIPVSVSPAVGLCDVGGLLELLPRLGLMICPQERGDADRREQVRGRDAPEAQHADHAGHQEHRAHEEDPLDRHEYAEQHRGGVTRVQLHLVRDDRHARADDPEHDEVQDGRIGHPIDAHLGDRLGDGAAE